MNRAAVKTQRSPAAYPARVTASPAEMVAAIALGGESIAQAAAPEITRSASGVLAR
jgi:hypothetical protein